MRNQILAVMVGGMMLFGSREAQAQTTNANALQRLFASDWEFRHREHPETATWQGDHRYDSKLTDLSPAAIERRKAHDRDMLARLGGIPRAGLSKQDALSYDLFKREKEVAVEGQQFPNELLALDQLDGPQLMMGQLIQVMPFTNKKEYDNYLARLAAYPTFMAQVMDLLRRGMAEGWTQPAVPLRGVPAQITGQLVDTVELSPYYAPFKAMPATITSEEQASLRAAARAAILDGVQPVLTRFREFVVDSYLPAGRSSPAISSVPDGADYYRFAIKRETTTNLTAEQIHQLGLSEVARIRKIMDSVITASGFKGSFADWLKFLRTDPQFYETSADGLVRRYRDLAKRIDPELPRLFAELPRAPYGVRPFPDYEAPSQTTARYYPGAADGSRAGYFMVNTYRLDARPLYELEALTLHEAVPGHHLQLSRAQELIELPDFRRNGDYTAYVEGGALYAESLGEELGFYRDPYSKFGQLTYEMWRACRLVVDTGIHAKGWSREQAIKYMVDNTAKSEQDVTVEVDRYIAWPGQALAYKLGELKIKELRAKAQRELGPKFDIRRFHNAVLDNGPLPLEILEGEMMAWISRESAISRKP
ncbi:MAG TPA: DUF885 domain-containing protein [Gemmatimonadales bacterium]|nr:DUF885 domain-containing protein [Gemmatimonadales bacterium]